MTEDSRATIAYNSAHTTDVTAACPLKVVRKHYREEADDFVLAVELCGGELWIKGNEYGPVWADGEAYHDSGVIWKIECEHGHVLLVPDHEGDDSYSQIPYKPEFWKLAFGGAS